MPVLLILLAIMVMLFFLGKALVLAIPFLLGTLIVITVLVFALTSIVEKEDEEEADGDL